MKLGLTRKAVEEKHLEIGIKASEAMTGYGEGERSLLIALKESPENPDALLALARIKSKFKPTEEGRELYNKAIEFMFKSRPDETAEVYKEFYGKYLVGVEPTIQYKVAGILYEKGDFDVAARAFEILARSSQAPPDIRENASFRSASTLEAMELYEAAADYYKEFLREFPDSSLAMNAKKSLDQLTDKSVTITREDKQAEKG